MFASFLLQLSWCQGLAQVPATFSLPWHSHVLTPSSLVDVTIQQCPGNLPTPPSPPGKGPVGGTGPNCAAGMRPQQSPGTGVSGQDRAWQGLWDPGLQGPGCPWGQAEPGRGPGSCQRLQSWCPLPGAQDMCMVLGALCPAPAARGLLVPTDVWSAVPPSQSLPLPRSSVVPVLVPLPRAQWQQCCCWCPWMALVAVLVSALSPVVVTVHGGTACCVVLCALCGAGASAHAGAGAQLLVPGGGAGLVPRYWWPCLVPTASVQCQVSLSSSGPSAF